MQEKENLIRGKTAIALNDLLSVAKDILIKQRFWQIYGKSYNQNLDQRLFVIEDLISSYLDFDAHEKYENLKYYISNHYYARVLNSKNVIEYIEINKEDVKKYTF